MTPCGRRHEQKAVSTIIAAIFMLLIMFSALMAVTIAFFNYNFSASEQMEIEHERSQEKIELAQLDIDNEFKITSLTINNTGTIDVKIRAIYQTVNNETKLLFDPSDYGDTSVSPAKSIAIYIPGDIPEVKFDPQAKLIAATERGTKTIDYVPTLLYGPIEPPSNYDPTKLYIGPLMLQFDNFTHHLTDGNGYLTSGEDWKPGWVAPPNKGNTGYAWRITVMNIDKRDITINRFTSFNLVPTEAPSTTLSWYLNATDHITNTQFLKVNQPEYITYIWDNPLSGSAKKLNLPQGTTCMVFLTFFGVFHNEDGTTTSYAQTIPFEASVSVSG